MERQDWTGRFGPLFQNSGKPEIPMYSFDRPAYDFWNGYVNALLKNGWTEERIITHLKSKETRWMLDAKEHHLEELGFFLAEQFVAEENERLSPQETPCTTPSTAP